MTDLRKYAEGKDCKIRVPGYCNANVETTVLAHLRMAGVTGIGQKAPDILGAWGCSGCHDVVDGRTRTDFEREFIRQMHMEGVIRTQAQLVRDGILHW